LRVIACDQPGFGLSDNPTDPSVAYRTRFVLAFMDALRLPKAHLVGHSQSGRIAVSLALEHGERVSRVVVLGTGSLLPPLPDRGKSDAAEGEDGAAAEPTLAETRRLLEESVFDRTLNAGNSFPCSCVARLQRGRRDQGPVEDALLKQPAGFRQRGFRGRAVFALRGVRLSAIGPEAAAGFPCRARRPWTRARQCSSARLTAMRPDCEWPTRCAFGRRRASMNARTKRVR